MFFRLIFCILVFSVASIINNISESPSSQHNESWYEQDEYFLDNSLKNKTNNNSTVCRTPAIDEFPHDFLTLEQKRNGGIILHIVIVLYLFCAVAVVCDEYFVQSLNRICLGKIRP